MQSPIVNRIRQDLAWQFPEAVMTSFDAPLFGGWLAGERNSARYDKKLINSSGLGLEAEVIHSAKAICELRVSTRIEPKRNRVKNALGTALGEIFDREKVQSRPIKLVRSQIASRAVDWLFTLVKELVTSNN
ncbi:MAG: hypothetical protein KME01_07330 [Chroococcus sp. CMT-3BRIN-NPC107]|nr:hypothetical protein [Chroococcus sp. CMT-3BRIN-NPC107]